MDHVDMSATAPVMIEVIATTLSDVRAAQAGGADRIELITAFAEGGLTPSLGLIEQAAAESTIPFRVMIRPHARSFVYDRDDMLTIVRDVELARSAGAKAIVFGALTADGQIDEEALRRVLDAAGPMDMTFHRAIDESADIMKALETIISYKGITDILTSGGADHAVQAASTIRRMVETAKPQGVHILAGSGLHADNVMPFLRETGVERVHFGSAVRVDGKALNPIETARIQTLRASLAAL
ncbi:copper homeostasis protein CutC [Paenibacillus marinisediminis]